MKQYSKLPVNRESHFNWGRKDLNLHTGFIRRTFFLSFILSLGSFVCTDIFGQNTNPDEYHTQTISSNFVKLLDFDGPNTGSNPSQIILVGDLIYGVCTFGGANDDGILFTIKTDGSGFQKIDFIEEVTGACPTSVSITYTSLLGWVIVGATFSGGLYNKGTLFKVDKNGFRVFQNLDFGTGDFLGTYVYDIIVKDYSLYGIGWNPYSGEGVVFFDNLFGLGMKTLANLDGWPRRGLLAEGDYLYGTTHGSYGSGPPGVLYKLKTDGSEFYTLHQFDSQETGIWPSSNVVMLDDTLFGVTSAGGIYNFGTVYKIAPDGGGFERLGDYPPEDENDAYGCEISYLSTADSSLYGMDLNGGINNLGALVRLNYATGLTKMVEFQDQAKGVSPGSFAISEDIVYGITRYGGAFGQGTLYKYYLNGLPAPEVEHAKTIKLSITPPVRVKIRVLKNMFVEYGQALNLDTVFTVEGDIPYEYSWNSFDGSNYSQIAPSIQVTSDNTYYLFLNTAEGCSYIDSAVVNVKYTSIPNIKAPDNTFKVFPNPNKGTLTIDLESAIIPDTYELRDIYGRMVMQGILTASTREGRYLLDLMEVQPGIYYFSLKRGLEIIGSQKIMVIE